MLILTRRIGEALMIGADVKIIVVGVNGIQARIAIDAPRSVTVHREEVFRRIERGEPRQYEKTGQASRAVERVPRRLVKARS